MKTLSAQELKDRIEDSGDTLVIDVLPEEHHRRAHVPGSANIPLDDGGFVAAVDDAAESKAQPIVVYCANTDCSLSPHAARELKKAGFENVADFEGGIEEWKAAGFKTESG